ncbi:MAG: hotdog fold thioesterase [Bdellovibrionales bacterium]|nr:hotdog fold thioesterase [Bdellovibrionales bacterium]
MKMEIEEGLEDKVSLLEKQRTESMDYQLGMNFLKLSRDEVIATLPVDSRTRQPFGLLHGGASVVLAESLASCGAWLNIDESQYAAVGIEINANHLRAVRSGQVTGRAVPIRKGKTIQVWEIDIRDEKKRRVCLSRCTIAVVPINRV